MENLPFILHHPASGSILILGGIFAYKLHTIPELVADIPHCLNKGMGGVLNLAPKSSDMDVHRPIAAVVVVTPDLVQESFTGKDTASVNCQKFE